MRVYPCSLLFIKDKECFYNRIKFPYAPIQPVPTSHRQTLSSLIYVELDVFCLFLIFI